MASHEVQPSWSTGTSVMASCLKQFLLQRICLRLKKDPAGASGASPSGDWFGHHCAAKALCQQLQDAVQSFTLPKDITTCDNLCHGLLLAATRDAISGRRRRPKKRRAPTVKPWIRGSLNSCSWRWKAWACSQRLEKR